jgi:hypothetical protein
LFGDLVRLVFPLRTDSGDSCDDVGLVFLSDFGDLVWLLCLATLFGDLVRLVFPLRTDSGDSCDDVGLVFLSDFGDSVWLLCLAALFGYSVWRLSLANFSAEN